MIGLSLAVTIPRKMSSSIDEVPKVRSLVAVAIESLVRGAAILDELGPVIGRGGVWVNESVKANTASDPFLVTGYDRRGLHLSHAGNANASIEIATDSKGKTGNGRP